MSCIIYTHTHTHIYIYIYLLQSRYKHNVRFFKKIIEKHIFLWSRYFATISVATSVHTPYTYHFPLSDKPLMPLSPLVFIKLDGMLTKIKSKIHAFFQFLHCTSRYFLKIYKIARARFLSQIFHFPWIHSNRNPTTS